MEDWLHTLDNGHGYEEWSGSARKEARDTALSSQSELPNSTIQFSLSKSTYTHIICSRVQRKTVKEYTPHCGCTSVKI